MQEFQPVTRLREVGRAVELEPLPSGDSRYVDMAEGRRTDELEVMRVCVQKFDAEQNRFAKIALTGHRGCGKSTELLRLEHDLAGRFTSLHFVATEDEIITDYDYAELFLDLSDALIRKFQEWNLPLDAQRAEDVAIWFAEVTLGEIETVKKEIALGIEAEAGLKPSLFGLSLGLLAKLRSMIAGSNEKRREIRHKIQRDPLELIRRFNLLLDNAHITLQKAGKPANLLIVVDNLDRVTAEVGRKLFFDGGDLLKMPRAHVLYTVPIATALSTRDNISMVFNNYFVLPMVKVRTRDGKAFKQGRDDLIDVAKKRIDLDAVFASRVVVRKLAESCGGSIRDLMRLIDYAQMVALARNKETIDNDSAQRAALKMRTDYERLLVPAGSYFPLLARIHQTKGDGALIDTSIDSEKVKNYRVFFNDLLTNGSVLQYDGGETWYDVHPVIQDIRAFRDALAPPEGS